MRDKKFSFGSVLIVDDSEIDVLINRRLIELTSFASSITITHTAEAALDYLRNECADESSAPDFIFLDLYLPGMSGYEFTDVFSTLPEFIRKKSRIVVLSVFQKPEKLAALLTNPVIYSQANKPLTQEVLHALSATVHHKVSV